MSNGIRTRLSVGHGCVLCLVDSGKISEPLGMGTVPVSGTEDWD